MSVTPILEQIPDLRAELLAIELAYAETLDLKSVVFLPQGLLRRALTQDVHRIDITSLPGEPTTNWQFFVNREGFYEALPDALLHVRQERNADESTADIIRRFEQTEQEKADARTFFLPFEQVFYQLRSVLEQWESSNYMGWLGGGRGTALSDFWDLPDWLTGRQALLACYVFPALHRITGNLPLTEAVFEAMLDCPVGISYTDPGPVSSGLSHGCLGSTFLGVDAILGDKVAEGLPGLHMHFYEWSTERLVTYFRGGNDARLIDWLCAYFLPAGLELRIEIEVRPEDRIFHFDVKKEGNLLGYTTNI